MIRIPLRTENGVSPVIAALLILMLTILLTGIFAAGIISMSTAPPTPIAGITISANNGILTLTHYSGDTLMAGEYKILVDGIDQTRKFQGDVRDFAPGTKLVWDTGTSEPPRQVSVVYTGGGGAVVIAEKQFYSHEINAMNAGFTVRVAEGKNATSQVKVGVSDAKPLPGVIADRADVWVVPDQISKQATVVFTAEESSPDTAYFWTGGNGQTADTREASFVYDTAGIYTVQLGVRNTTSGSTGTSSLLLSVRDPGITSLAWVKRDMPITGGILARTTGSGTGLSSNAGGWAFQYDDPRYFGIEFKVVLTDSVNKSFHHARSRVEMVPGSWYHTAGIVNQSGTNPLETLQIYVNGEDHTHITSSEINIVGKRYLEPVRSTVNRNLSFDVSSYSEVPFPLTSAEIAAIYTAELGEIR